MGAETRLAAASGLVEHRVTLAAELALEDGDVHLVWFVWYEYSIEPKGLVSMPLVTVWRDWLRRAWFLVS